MNNYRLVYMLAYKDEGGAFIPMIEYGEFQNRAAAKEFFYEKTFDRDIYLIRKEVSIFYDRKLVDKVES